MERKSDTVDLPANIDGLDRREDEGRTVAVKFNVVRVASIFDCEKSNERWMNEEDENGRNVRFEAYLGEITEIIYERWNPRERKWWNF